MFFCQNNQWAISEPIERQTRIPLYQRALGFGFPGVRVDGNDVLATYAVTQAALQRARDGQGPTLVEAYTYRMGAHTTTDDPTRYRLSDDVERWKLKDPIARVEVYLKPQRPGRRRRSSTRVEAGGRRARPPPARGLQGAARPEAADMFDHVYAEETEELRAQREGFAAYLETLRGERADEPRRRRSRSPRASTWACARRWRTTPRSSIMGEDVGKLGGVFRITDGLQKDFGEDRVIDSPLAESGIVGTAVGMALRGYRPVVEIQFDGFVYPAYDQIVCQVAKMTTAPRAARRCRWSSGSRSAAASARSSTTRESPGGAVRAHARASRWSPAPTRSTATG